MNAPAIAALAALLLSTSGALAAAPVKLTDTQLDAVTAAAGPPLVKPAPGKPQKVTGFVGNTCKGCGKGITLNGGKK